MTEQQILYKIGRFIITLIQQMIKFAEETEQTNTQTLMDILDEINKLSVKY